MSLEPSQITVGITITEAAAAEAYIYEVDYWITGMPIWGILWSDPTGPIPASPPNYSSRPAEIGEAVYFSIGWFNTGTVAVTGHVDLELTAPSGIKYNLTAYQNQDNTKNPGSGTHVVFNALTLNEAGTWQIKATISHAGGILDEETTSFIVEAPPTHIVGVAMYDGSTEEYVIGTLIVDGVRYTGVQYKILFGVEKGVHTFNVELPAGYTFVEWQITEYGGAPIGTSTARPLSVNIDQDIWIWAEVAAETQNLHVYGYETSAGSLRSFGDVTLDGVTKSGAEKTRIDFYGIEVGNHTIELKNLLAGYTFDHWSSIIGGSWVEVLIDNPYSISTGITTQSGGSGGLRAWLTPPAPTTLTLESAETRVLPPAFVHLTTRLTSQGVGVPGKTIKFYQNGVYRGANTTDSTGTVTKTQYVSDERGYSFQTVFAGDAEYEGSESPTITIAVNIPTMLTISVPDKVGVGEKFFISGILYETDTSIPIPNQPINHSYNGKSLGTSTTGVDGNYLKEASVPESGVWTVKSEFLGTEILQASKTQVNATVVT